MNTDNENIPVSDRILTKKELVINFFNDIKKFIDDMEKFMKIAPNEYVESKAIFISNEFIKMYVNFLDEIDMLIEKYERENNV